MPKILLISLRVFLATVRDKSPLSAQQDAPVTLSLQLFVRTSCRRLRGFEQLSGLQNLDDGVWEWLRPRGAEHHFFPLASFPPLLPPPPPPFLSLHAQVVWESLQCKCDTYLFTAQQQNCVTVVGRRRGLVGGDIGG